MTKKRIIPALLLQQGTQVKLSREFHPWRVVGTLTQYLRLHVGRNADELIIIDLDSAFSPANGPNPRTCSLVTKQVDIPISYAGGVSTMSMAADVINNGFDRVFVTSAFLNDGLIASQIAGLIGSQSLGVILPYKCAGPDAERMLWDYKNLHVSQTSLIDSIQAAISSGVGEIVLYSVDRDGSLAGMDLSLLTLLDKIKPRVSVLVAGGCGTASHALEMLRSKWVQGIVASSVFALTCETPKTIRAFCQRAGVDMRISVCG
jgi:cyclase